MVKNPTKKTVERPKPGQLVRIQAHRDGYRRAGLGHTKAPFDHGADAFDDQQLAQLFDDPNISVSYVDAPKTEKAAS